MLESNRMDLHHPIIRSVLLPLLVTLAATGVLPNW